MPGGGFPATAGDDFSEHAEAIVSPVAICTGAAAWPIAIMLVPTVPVTPTADVVPAVLAAGAGPEPPQAASAAPASAALVSTATNCPVTGTPRTLAILRHRRAVLGKGLTEVLG